MLRSRFFLEGFAVSRPTVFNCSKPIPCNFIKKQRYSEKQHTTVALAYENFCRYFFVSNYLTSLQEICATKNALFTEVCLSRQKQTPQTNTTQPNIYEKPHIENLKKIIEEEFVAAEKNKKNKNLDAASKGLFINV